MCKGKLNISNTYFILFYPKIIEPLYFSEFFYPYSLEFIIQCYFRIKGRKDHETLDPSKKEDFYAVLFLFVQFYKDFHFAKIFKFDFLFMKYEISYCDIKESEMEEKSNLDILTCFEEIMSKVKIEDMPSANQEMKDFIQLIEKNYKNTDFKDTKEIIQQEIKSCKISYKK